ncbi:MAG: UDPGP type 1 family protein [Isosphaeraceae bacterium]|nr:UDPGP type 1 family protein [Isosphaeraceae bacterium]
MATPPDPALVERLERFGQSGLLAHWDGLGPADRATLVEEIASIDLERLDRLIERFVKTKDAAEAGFDPATVEPIEVARLPQTDGERSGRRLATDLGESVLAAGEVGVLIVAGGSGTRLGFEGPKGTYPIGAVSGSSLFQIHAEKIRALGRKYGRVVPLYIMTSPENHEATVAFFESRDRFGLEHVRFFTQGQMPAVDAKTGAVLLSAPSRVALAPDGHGGTFDALAAPAPGGGPSCLEEMRSLGLRTLFYFQVDNPLVKIADPAFLGLHRSVDAEMSFKVIEKLAPDERVGVVVKAAGRPLVIEYSDLPPALAERRGPGGELELWAGSIAIHLLELDFIDRIVSGSVELPFHKAVKKVPHFPKPGSAVFPLWPNAIKFERFIFDALPLAERWAMMETDRAIEFEPLKNAEGPDSPASVRARMTELFAGWLEAAGARIARDETGNVPFPIEISPLFAFSGSELKGKVNGLEITGPTYLAGE